jgi:hypothetical protein
MNQTARWSLRVAAGLTFLLGGFVSAASGIVVNIDDSGEVPFATIDGNPVTLLADSRPDLEFLHFLVDRGLNSDSTTSHSRDLLEPVTFELSDRLLIGFQQGSPIMDVQFASDPFQITVGQVVSQPLVEDGTFQSTFIFFLGVGNPSNVGFFVKSDVETVPEPSTFVLGGLGLMALFLVGLRRPALPPACGRQLGRGG